MSGVCYTTGLLIIIRTLWFWNNKLILFWNQIVSRISTNQHYIYGFKFSEQLLQAIMFAVLMFSGRPSKPIPCEVWTKPHGSMMALPVTTWPSHVPLACLPWFVVSQLDPVVGTPSFPEPWCGNWTQWLVTRWGGVLGKLHFGAFWSASFVIQNHSHYLFSLLKKLLMENDVCVP